MLDYKPRVMTPLQRRVLEVHASCIVQQLELTRALIKEVKNPGADSEESPALHLLSEHHKEVLARYENLTPREKEILQLFAARSGSLSSKDVAHKLDISPRTVDHHRANIMAKMNVASIAELMAVGLKAGIFR